jgi:hypothetical protein
MSIPIQRYVNILSGQGAGTNFPTRDLIGRIFTGNEILPPQTFIEFTNAADVGAFFGTASEEYYRALFYFAWISKNNEQAESLQFARWSQFSSEPMIFSPSNNNSTWGTNWTSITSGSFAMTIGSVTNVISSLNFASTLTLADVAAVVQTGLLGFGISETGTLLSTVNTITGLASISGLVPGLGITDGGVDIPADTTISAVFPSTTQTGTSHGTIHITGLTDTSLLTVGQTVTGGDIFAGSTIVTIVSGTAIDLSHITTGSNTEVLTFGPYVTMSNAATGSTTETITFGYPTVTYNGNGGFTFTSGLPSALDISVSIAGGGTNILAKGLLGWLPAMIVTNGQLSGSGAIWANGSNAETITDCLTTSASNSTNFGSFLFLNNLNLSVANAVLAAQWNFTQNVLYLYTIAVNSSNYTSYTDPVLGVGAIGGCALTLTVPNFSIVGTLTSTSAVITNLDSILGLQIGMPISDGVVNIPAGAIIVSIDSENLNLTMSLAAIGSGTESITFTEFEFPEQFPMMIEAATNYYALNSVQNYMFQQDNTGSLQPTVFSNTDANTYDNVYVNYYGQTQSAGTQIDFYQRGSMQGQNISTNIKDMTSYVNEIWLKDAVTTAFMNLLLALNQIPANAQGQAQLLTVLQGVINQALANGTISVGKTLSQTQKVYIGAATGDQDAWYQVQNSGYWANIVIVLIDTDYVAQYTCIYSKDDTIRLVNGTQTLI